MTIPIDPSLIGGSNRKKKTISVEPGQIGMETETVIPPPVNVASSNVVENFGSGANETLAAGLQFPIDVGRDLYALSTGTEWGGDKSHVPGEGLIRDLFEKMGLVGEQPTTGYAARIGSEVMKAPLYAAPVLSAAAKGVQAGKYLQPMLDFAAKKPMATSAADVALSATGGAVAEFGRQKFGETGDQLGFLAGSMAPVALPYLATKVPSLLGRAAMKPIHAVTSGLNLTQGGRERRAADVLSRNIGPEARATLEAYDPNMPGSLETPTAGGGYTVGELTGDRQLLNLQRSLRDRPTSTVSDTDRLAGLTDEAAVLRPDDPSDLSFPAARVGEASAVIKNSIRRAVENAERKLAALNPGESRDAISVEFREEFDRIYSAANAAENSIWKQVGAKGYETEDLISRARQIIAEEPRLKGDIPVLIRQIAGKDAVLNEKGEAIEKAVPSILRPRETEEEIAGLMSNLSGEVRVLRSQGELNKARILNNLLNEVRLKIRPVDGDTSKLAEARAFSRNKAQHFKQNRLAQLTESGRAGGRKLSAEETLEALVKGDLRGKKNVEDLRKAAAEFGGRGTATVDDTVTRYLIAKFSNKSMREGEAFSRSAATKFVADHPVLDLYPKLKAQMLDSAEAQRLAERANRVLRVRLNNIEAKGLASKFIGEDVELFVDRVRKQANPLKGIKSLLNLASKDPSGDTLKGIQVAFYDDLIKRAIVNDVFDAGKLTRYLSNKTNRLMVKQVFGDDQLRLLDEVKKGIILMKSTSKYPSRAAQMGMEMEEKIRRKFAVGGAMIGGMLSKFTLNHPLIMAGIGRRTAERFTDDIARLNFEKVNLILEKALTDPALAKELLSKKLMSQKNWKVTAPRLALLLQTLEETPEAMP